MRLAFGSGFVHGREIVIDDELFAAGIATKGAHRSRDRHGGFFSELTFLDRLRSHGEILPRARRILERLSNGEYKANMIHCLRMARRPDFGYVGLGILPAARVRIS